MIVCKNWIVMLDTAYLSIANSTLVLPRLTELSQIPRTEFSIATSTFYFSIANTTLVLPGPVFQKLPKRLDTKEGPQNSHIKEA